MVEEINKKMEDKKINVSVDSLKDMSISKLRMLYNELGLDYESCCEKMIKEIDNRGAR